VPARLPQTARRASKRAYTRRRIVAALVLTLIVLASWVAVRALESTAVLGAPTQPSPTMPVATGSYVVQPGETFWSIVRRVDPAGDPRPVVDRLVAAHGGSQLQAGDVIVLPAR
jgi:nucleoid-associated protein YgaU